MFSEHLFFVLKMQMRLVSINGEKIDVYSTALEGFHEVMMPLNKEQEKSIFQKSSVDDVSFLKHS